MPESCICHEHGYKLLLDCMRFEYFLSVLDDKYITDSSDERADHVAVHFLAVYC